MGRRWRHLVHRPPRRPVRERRQRRRSSAHQPVRRPARSGTALTDVSYRAVFAVPEFPRLAVTSLFSRIAGSMWQLALVLFVLERFRSPELAGLAGFLSIAPR